ncbi:hypothetical protein LOAG_00383 [Loa loa]|uniref:Uncharacterized protein n=1 Tax=Loa loa TaxID=7209 RepID=A0A1S0UBK5_LOALO|nr:hypothetical protein LOAG_00383 [Loa loa]EFO28097.1 hypothetical protein LOAG_00383 [Loa loa]
MLNSSTDYSITVFLDEIWVVDGVVCVKIVVRNLWVRDGRIGSFFFWDWVSSA